ncbi:MAG TPA: hypothetical protein ACQGQH_06985 [Xylella sp.]
MTKNSNKDNKQPCRKIMALWQYEQKNSLMKIAVNIQTSSINTKKIDQWSHARTALTFIGIAQMQQTLQPVTFDTDEEHQSISNEIPLL